MSERQKLDPVHVILPEWSFVCWFVGWLVFSICSFSPSPVPVFGNWKQYVAERFWFVGGGKWILLFQTSFSTKKKRFRVVKEKYNNSFFQDQKCFREMSVLLENAILIKIERFNRELKIEIQLSPFAPDPSCEMLTDCAYPMGLLPSATTFFDLCAWYFLLAIPV